MAHLHRPRSAIVWSIAFISAISAYAHREPETLTTIEFNANTDRTEIIHRIHIHDAEYALSKIAEDSELSFDSLEGQARFALYVEESFTLSDSTSNQPYSLELIGARLEGNDILVFQEFETALPPSFKANVDILRAYFPAQTNTLIVTHDSTSRTWIFSGDDEWKEIQL